MISAIQLLMKNKTLLSFALIAALGPVLSACGLGYSKNPPNEFNVVRRAPLIIPPEFDLRPPSHNQRASSVISSAEIARLTVLRSPQGAKQPDAVEGRLLEKAANGGTYGDGIRDALENERSGKVSIDADLVETLTEDQAQSTAE